MQAIQRLFSEWLEALKEDEVRSLHQHSPGVDFSGFVQARKVACAPKQYPPARPNISADKILANLPELLAAYQCFLRNVKSSAPLLEPAAEDEDEDEECEDENQEQPGFLGATEPTVKITGAWLQAMQAEMPVRLTPGSSYVVATVSLSWHMMHRCSKVHRAEYFSMLATVMSTCQRVRVPAVEPTKVAVHCCALQR